MFSIAACSGPGQYQDIYAHSKVALIDDGCLDTSSLDDASALRALGEHARANRDRRARGQVLEGLACALDPTTYAR